MVSSVATSFLLFTISTISAVSISNAADAEYKNDCFYLNHADNCESKTIDINQRLYGCDSEVDFDAEITKIQFQTRENDEQIILVQDSNSNSYTIDEIGNIKKESDLGNLESCTYIVDENENAYKIESGEASVTGPKGIVTRPIKTDNDLNPIELALDPVTGKLVILSVGKNPSGGTREGSLFALDVDKINSVGRDSELRAERISPINVVITGVSIYEGLDDLVVGIKLGGKFKYVKLTAVPENHKCYRQGRKADQPPPPEPILEIEQEMEADNVEREPPTTTTRRTTTRKPTTKRTTTTTESPTVTYTFDNFLFKKLSVGANLLDQKLAYYIKPFADLLNDPK